MTTTMIKGGGRNKEEGLRLILLVSLRPLYRPVALGTYQGHQRADDKESWALITNHSGTSLKALGRLLQTSMRQNHDVYLRPALELLSLSRQSAGRQVSVLTCDPWKRTGKGQEMV